MGESAVLLRSFYHPSDAFREAREGDPIRALTESISFGRFMSDSLAWEKWSTFSHNRYLEKVEKFSKPGSVAQKKAYFEAHYKRKAAMKVAAAKEANAAANDVPELKTTSEIQNNYPMDTESVKANSHVGINEQKEQYMVNTSTDSATDTKSEDMNHAVAYDQWEEDSPDTEVVHSADANACDSINTPDDLEDADTERSEAIMENAVNEENPTQTDNLKQLQNPDVDNKIVASPVERMHNKEVVDQENSASSSKKKQSICSSKSSSQSGVSGLMSYPAKQVPSLPARNVENIATNSKESVGDSNEKKRVVSKFLYKSINFSPRVSETSKAFLQAQKQFNSYTNPNQSNFYSLYSLIYLSTHSQHIQACTNLSVIRNLWITSASFIYKLQASVNGVSKHLSKLFQSENKRSEAQVSKSVSGGITKVGLFLSLPVEGLESSSANRRKARSPPSISSPFSFKSKERAAKRKEFFEKLEEKNNTKGAEEGQLETRSKERVEQDSKKLRQSTGFKAKQNEHLYHGSRLPNIHMKKEKAEHDFEKLQQSTGFKAKPNGNSHHCPPLPSNRMKKWVLNVANHALLKPLSRPWSPKLGGKSTPTVVQDTVQDTGSWPPWKPSVNTESSKPVLVKNKQSTTRSVTSLPKLGRKPTSNPVQVANTRPPWRSSMNTASFKRIIEKNNTNTNRSVSSLPKKNAHENEFPKRGVLFT